jgi:hypothetical protein
MGDDGGYTDVGISKGVVFEILIVDGVGNRKDLLFKFFSNACIRFEFFHGMIKMIVGAIGSCDVCNSSSSGMYWLGAGISGLVKSSAGSDNVGSGWHDKSKMAVEATSAVRMNRSRIGVQFFLELADGGGGWFARNEG